MLKKLLIINVIILSTMVCWSQESLGIRHINVSYGHVIGGIGPGIVVYSGSGYIHGTAVIVDVAPWQIGKTVSTGFYLGGGPAAYSESSSYLINTVAAVRFGISAHWHLLPLVCTETNNHWDVSLGGTLGSYWSPYAQLNLEYCASVCANYYPFKHWGIFAEYGWGKILYGNQGSSRIGLGNTLIKAGISYRW